MNIRVIKKHKVINSDLWITGCLNIVFRQLIIHSFHSIKQVISRKLSNSSQKIMLAQDDIKKEQRRLKEECISFFKQQLENGRDFFLSVFPNATIRAVLDAGEKSAPARPYVHYRIEKIQSAVEAILHSATSDDPLTELKKVDLENLQLTERLSERLIKALVHLISCGRNLLENDFIFLGEVSAALNFPPSQVHLVIDQVQYESRKAFFNSAQTRLDEDQRDLCAILLLTAIRADDSVHPAEFKYFENISQLLNYDQARLEHIGISTASFDFNSSVRIPHDIAVYLFEYLVEIVMCDRQYDPKESLFIQNVARTFGFDKRQQDDIIQPTAAALIIKADLFQ